MMAGKTGLHVIGAATHPCLWQPHPSLPVNAAAKSFPYLRRCKAIATARGLVQRGKPSGPPAFPHHAAYRCVPL